MVPHPLLFRKHESETLHETGSFVAAWGRGHGAAKRELLRTLFEAKNLTDTAHAKANGEFKALAVLSPAWDRARERRLTRAGVPGP